LPYAISQILAVRTRALRAYWYSEVLARYTCVVQVFGSQMQGANRKAARTEPLGVICETVCRDTILSYVPVREQAVVSGILFKLALQGSPLSQLGVTVHLPTVCDNEAFAAVKGHANLRVSESLVFCKPVHFEVPPFRGTRFGSMALEFYTGEIGWGVMANSTVAANTTLFPYIGEVISSGEAKLRHENNLIEQVVFKR
jgi:hypothetical protein